MGLSKNCSSMDPQAFGFLVTFIPLEISKTDLTIIWTSSKNMNFPKFWRMYRVVKQNWQVVRFVDFGQMNEFMVQNSSPTCQHNLFTLIQIKKMFLKYLAMLKSSKRLRVSDLPCANSSKTAKFLRSMQPLPNGIS